LARDCATLSGLRAGHHEAGIQLRGLEHPLPERQHPQRLCVLEAPDRDSAEAALDGLDRLCLERVEFRRLPRARIEQRGALAAQAQTSTHPLGDVEEVPVLEEARGILASGRLQSIAEMDAEGLNAPRDGAGSAAPRADHEDRALTPGCNGPCGGIVGHALSPPPLCARAAGGRGL
jgi:hypothetical protein